MIANKTEETGAKKLWSCKVSRDFAKRVESEVPGEAWDMLLIPRASSAFSILSMARSFEDQMGFGWIGGLWIACDIWLSHEAEA
jgi:hypothetical protein